MPKRNPYVGKPQRELISTVGVTSAKPHGRESQAHVPIESLSDEELVELPRDAYTDGEWLELPEEIQEAIYESDLASEKRIKKLVDRIVGQWKFYTEEGGGEPPYNLVESYFEEWLREHADDLWKEDHRHQSEFLEEFTAEGYHEEQVKDAMNEVLQDSNIYEFSFGDEHGWAFFKDRIGEQTIYLDRDELEKLVRPLHPDELERAVDEIDRETNITIKPEKFYKAMRSRYGEFEVYFDTGLVVDGDPDWTKVHNKVYDILHDQEPKVEEAPIPEEERILYRFKDGSYVLDLLPYELPAEGKAMGMCVGRPEMGYIKKVRQGKTAIFSLRRPSGKPLFTIEAKLASKGKVARIVGIKGKANRKPGFDLGKEGENLKKDEVAKVLEFLESLKVPPDSVHDLEPALRALGIGPPRENPRRRSKEGHCGFCCHA